MFPILRFGIFFCILLGLAQSVQYRLPSTISPINYNLTVYPNFKNLTFTGLELIQLNTTQYFDSQYVATDSFSLQLNVGPDVTVNQMLTYLVVDNTQTSLSSLQYNPETQIVNLTFGITNANLRNALNIDNAESEPNDLYLNTEWTGVLRQDMKGFYISKYDMEDSSSGQSQTILNAVTQFEATDARRAFPCFDEPQFKATFDISYIAPSTATTVGNMEITESVPEPDLSCPWLDPRTFTQTTACKRVTFETTVKMSTYLVAFVIGGYDSISNETSSDIEMGVYYPLNYQASSARYALKMSLKTLPFFNQLYDFDYPLDKLDSVAVNDFAAGAMENWGLMLYRTSYLLVDKDSSSQKSLESAVFVIAHEIAHQWFGNLVTMQYWDGLWLNEGFARYMQFVASDALVPHFDVWDSFYSRVASVLIEDGSLFTHAVVDKNQTWPPDSIMTAFDSITYNKGAAILKTCSNYISFESFVKGIQNYIKKYQYSNAATSDLWEELELVRSDLSITSMMDKYVYQAGFPLLYVNLSAVHEDGNVYQWTLNQQRFVNQGPDFYYKSSKNLYNYWTDEDVEEFSDQLWDINVNASLANREFAIPPSGAMFSGRTDAFLLPRTFNSEQKELYLVNSGYRSYYRVYYNALAIDIIASSFKLLTYVDQFRVINDRFALMKAGYITAPDYLEFLESIELNGIVKIKNRYLVWDAIISSLIWLDDVLCEWSESVLHDPSDRYLTRLYVREFSRDLVHGVYDDLERWNFDGIYSSDDDDDASEIDSLMLRSRVIQGMIRFQDLNVIEEGYDVISLPKCSDANGLICLENGYLKGYDPNIIQQVFEAYLSYGTSQVAQLNKVIQIYKLSNLEQQQWILNALGSVYQNEATTTAALNWLVGEGNVRFNLQISGLRSLRQCTGRFQVYQKVFEDNDAAVFNSFYNDGGLFSQDQITSLAETFANATYFNKVRDFFDNPGHVNSGTQRIVNRTFESIDVQYVFLYRNEMGLFKYLQKYIMIKYGDGWELYQIIILIAFASIALCAVRYAFYIASVSNHVSPQERMEIFVETKKLQRSLRESLRSRAAGGYAPGSDEDYDEIEQKQNQSLSVSLPMGQVSIPMVVQTKESEQGGVSSSKTADATSPIISKTNGRYERLPDEEPKN